VIVGQNIPLPPTSPPVPEPAPVIDPTGGGVPGEARYYDVDGNGFLSPIDAILVINYLNSEAFRRAQQQGQGEGEGEGSGSAALTAVTAQPAAAFASAAAPAATSAAAVDPGIPAVMYASSSVEIEVRERLPVSRQMAVVQDVIVQDQALAAIGAELGPIAPPALVAPAQAAKDQSADDLGWDELLSDLAHDQKNLGWKG
jgi:hypothetical protein